MRRVLLTLEYDGTAYAGWQRQLNAVTVQQRVEEALLALTGETHGVVGASRTDAGVHARGQAAHFDTDSAIPAERFFLALNTRLPPDIRAVASREVPPSFHARYQAVGKEYRYAIHNAPWPSALHRNQCVHVPTPLDDNAMHEAAQALLGTHDFSALCAAGSVVRDKVRTISAVSVTRQDHLITLRIAGNGFLYNMVRIVAGTLIDIGRNKLPKDALAQAVARRDRLLAGPTAPAHGLCLWRVAYRGDEPTA